MNLKRLYQLNLPFLLLIWIIFGLTIRPGWLIFAGGIVGWLLLVRLTAPGIFYTYLAFLNNRNNSDGALNRLRQAVAEQPALAYPYFVLGMMTAQRQLWDEALTNLKTAVNLSSGSKNIHYSIILGEAYRESGAYEQALEILTKLLNRGITSTKLYTDLAITYLKTKDYANCLNYANQARKQSNEAIEPVLLLGRAHFGLSQFQAAKDDYLWVMERLKYPVESYYWLGRCELELGQLDAARQHLQQAVAAITEDPLLSDVTIEEARHWLEKLS